MIKTGFRKGLVIMKLLFSLAMLSLLVTTMSQSKSDPLSKADQLIVVTTSNWDDVEGKFQRYERRDNRWQPVGEKIRIVVGRTGMAWGKGLHGEPPGEGPIKREGDGKSPAGVFSLSRAFGYAPKSTNKGIRLPYVVATGSLECVDDVKSAYYNRVLDRRRIKSPDWNSSEQMRRQDDQYSLGVIVDHNAMGEPSCGSCIFLHIWSGENKGTAGCTAMQADNIKQVVNWLDPSKRPLLVQLPQEQYLNLKSNWNLP